MRVLLVDDDLDQLDITSYMLRRDQFAVVEASDSEQALRRLRIERPDLIIVNLSLPPPGGVDLLRQIRAESHAPVLVVAARDDRQELLRCLELGAHDFISKPYVFRELTLRVRAILGRADSFPGEVAEARLERSDLRLEPETHEVVRGSLVTRLTPTEFRIFYLLAKNAERVVPAKQLFAYVWSSDAGAVNTLRSHICHLRKKLGLEGGLRGSIESVPAVGYVFRTSARPKENGSAMLAPEQLAAGS
jgi:DNA-binding response OmpR family regulator